MHREAAIKILETAARLNPQQIWPAPGDDRRVDAGELRTCAQEVDCTIESVLAALEMYDSQQIPEPSYLDEVRKSLGADEDESLLEASERAAKKAEIDGEEIVAFADAIDDIRAAIGSEEWIARHELGSVVHRIVQERTAAMQALESVTQDGHDLSTVLVEGAARDSEIRIALGAHDDESTVEAAKRVSAERTMASDAASFAPKAIDRRYQRCLDEVSAIREALGCEINEEPVEVAKQLVVDLDRAKADYVGCLADLLSVMRERHTNRPPEMPEKLGRVRP